MDSGIWQFLFGTDNVIIIMVTWTWIWRDDCGMAHVTPDELSLVYSLVSDSSLSMTVQGTEQPGLFLTAALLSQSCLQNTRWWEILMNYRLFNSSIIFFVDVFTREGITNCFSMLQQTSRREKNCATVGQKICCLLQLMRDRRCWEMFS